MSSSDIFSDSASIDSGVDDLQNSKFNYTGSFDRDGFRDRYGCQTWDRPFKQKYAGYFLYNNMHDKGFYFIKQEGEVSFYDGQFYNNKLEGYGQVIFNDGKVHEGLFKDNRKFGPGVLSYPDGTQDVGLWNGNYLIRLSLSVNSDIVPSLCNNPVSKIKLLRFKKIVPALPKRKDVAKDLMIGLTDDEGISQRYPELYNSHIRNENSLFFDRRLYDLAQLGSEDNLIEVIEDEAFVDAISEVTDSEDAFCPCTNERCIHITKQISELESESLRIHAIKMNFEKQLQRCKQCCKVIMTAPSRNTPKSSSANSNKTEGVEVITYPTEASVVAPSQDKEKKSDQIRIGDADISVDLREKPIDKDLMETTKKTMPRTEESINKLFMCTKEFQNDQSSDTTDDDTFSNAIEKYTCTCIDEEIPDADFLIEQLEKLDRQEKFYQRVLDFLNKVLFREYSTVKKSNSSRTVKLQVEDLLTWNNGQTSIEILQHSFRYRNFENILSFKIKSLLVGDRAAFGKVGNVEAICINFLNHCFHNQLNEVHRDLFHRNVYPDLADARGNTGLHFAVINDCHDILRQLANVGASLDAFNDECLTPLLLTILRYIATLNKVVFWDRAFLSEITLNSRELDQVTQWRPHESLVSLREFMGSSSHLLEKKESLRKGIEDMSTMIRSRLLSSKSSSIASRINLNYVFSTSFIEDYQKYKKVVALKKVEDVEDKDLERIARTIELLLHYGADPNIGDLPMKPLLLSVFTKNITLVENLLKHNANPDSVTEENLSALHILSTLPFCSENVQIAERLLNHSSDPNRKCGNDLWLDQNEELIGTFDNNLVENEDYDGKTPLQIIAMRKDFDEENVDYQCNLVKVLIENGGRHDQYYLGHTLLSLAVLRGNRKLIETLYRYAEFEQPLGENMGNALTVLGLCRFPFVKHFTDCKTTIDELISLGMNPFNPVYDFPNIFEFFLYEYSHDVDFDIPRVRTSLEAEDALLRRSLFSSNPGDNKVCNKLAIAYLKEIGRNILIRLYQYKSIQILLRFAEQDLLYHICLENMAMCFTVSEALDYLRLFINENNIKVDSDYQKIILKLLNFIRVNSRNIKKVAKKYLPIVSDSSLILEDEVSKLNENVQLPNYITMYAFDSNPGKYEVCFHCMRKSDKKLICCPCCGSVKFCSEMCNKYSNKSNTKHTCNLLFYNEEKNKYGMQIDTIPLTGIDLLMHEAKLAREEERMTDLLRRQVEEEEKLKKPLRRSQKLDSQFSFHERKSKTPLEKSASVSFSTDAASKKKICCRKPSSIFICDEMAQLQPRKLNCGFHCGQVIPNVHLDDTGNIVREQEFCECYPLYEKNVSNVVDANDHPSATVPESEDNVSKHYNLSEIYDGAFVNESKNQEAKELDTLIDNFVKDERKKSINSEVIKHDETEMKDTIKTREQKQRELEGDINFDEIEKDEKNDAESSEKHTAEWVSEEKHTIKTEETDKKDTKKEKERKHKNEEFDAEPVKSAEKPTVDEASKQKYTIKTDETEKKGTKRRKIKSRKVDPERAESTEKSTADREKHKNKTDETEEKVVKKRKERKVKSKEADTKPGEFTKKPKADKVSEKKYKIKTDETERRSTKGENEKKFKLKKVDTEHSAPTADRASKQKNTFKTDETQKKSTKKKKERKIKSETEVQKKKKVKNESFKSETEISSAKKKKKSKKAIHSESTLDADDIVVGDSHKHNKKTMTKIPKSKKKVREKEAGIQVNIKHKNEETSGRSIAPLKKRKKSKEKNVERMGREIKKIDKMKGLEEKKESKKKTRSVDKEPSEKLNRKNGLQKDDTIESKEKGEYKQKKEKKVKSKKSDKQYKEKITTRKIKQEKLHPEKSKTDDADKGKMDATIFKTLASIRTLDAKLLHPRKILSLSGSSYEEFQRISKAYQYFLELIAKYFPDFDLSCLMLPFACFLDGQLYYKFADALPYYCRTYSAV